METSEVEDFLNEFSTENHEIDAELLLRIRNCMNEESTLDSRVNDINQIYAVYLDAIVNIHSKSQIITIALSPAKSCLTNVLTTIENILANNNCDKSPEIEKHLSHNITLCSNVLESLIFLLKHISSIDQIHLSSIETLPNHVGKILLQVFSHCKSSESLYAAYFQSIVRNITHVFKKCRELQALYFSVLTKKIIYDLSQGRQMDIVTEVLDLVVLIGEVVASLDAKTMAEQWKGYAKICEQHEEYLKCNFYHERAVTFLCSEIKKNIDLLVSNEFCDNQSSTRCLKISNFLLKILIKLCESFGGFLVTDSKPLVILLCYLYQYSPDYLIYLKIKPLVIEGVRSHISVGSEPLTLALLSDTHFRTAYIDYLKDGFNNERSLNFGCLMLSAMIMKILLQVDQDVRNDWCHMSEENNIMCCLFDYLPHCHMELTLYITASCTTPGIVSLYDLILVHTSVLTISCSDLGCVENKMLNCILKGDMWSALMALDLWIIVARYGSAELCYEQVTYLFNCYHNLTALGFLKATPQGIFMSNLLCRLFKILPKKMKNDFLSKYPIMEYQKIWRAVGFDGFSQQQSIMERENILDTSCKSLSSFLCGSIHKVDDYNAMINILLLVPSACSEILADSQSPKLSVLIPHIVNAWQCISSTTEKVMTMKESCVPGKQWFLEYVLLMCKLTCCLGNQFSNEQWLKILRVLSSIIEKSQSCVKISLLQILKSISIFQLDNDSNERAVTTLIANSFRALLMDKFSIIWLMSMETFAYLARDTSKENIVTLTVSGSDHLKEKITNFLLKKYVNDSNNLDESIENKMAVFKHKCEIKDDFESDIDVGEFDYFFEDECEVSTNKKPRLCINNDSEFEDIVERLLKDSQRLNELLEKNKIDDSQKQKILAVKYELEYILN